jgi:RNA polymerase sigma-70 factor, ECF subfamily
MKVAVNLCINDLRKKRWQNVSLDDLDYDPALFHPKDVTRFWDMPEKRVMKKRMIEMLNSMMVEHLSNKQYRALTALFTYGMPLNEIAERMGSNRNAVYKLMHDGRKKLKKVLEEQEITWELIHDLF